MVIRGFSPISALESDSPGSRATLSIREGMASAAASDWGERSVSQISLGVTSSPTNLSALKVQEIATSPSQGIHETHLNTLWDREVSMAGKVLHSSGIWKTNIFHLDDVPKAPINEDGTNDLMSDDITWTNDFVEHETKHKPSYEKYKSLASEIVEKMQRDPTRGVSIATELIAKILSYSRLPPDTVVPIPTQCEGRLVLAEYRPLLIDLTDGNAAYLFVPTKTSPKEARPILTFRGTSPQHASGSVRADLGIHSATSNFLSLSAIPEIDFGRNIIATDGKRLTNLIADAESRYGKVTVTGYSLGGSLAAKVAMDKKNYRFIDKVVTFNAPCGGSSADLRKFEHLVRKGELAEDFGEAYAVEGDSVGNSFGFENFIGRKFLISVKDGKSRDATALHGECLLGKEFELSAVRPTNNDWNIGMLFFRTICAPVYIATWIISRFSLLLVSASIEAYFATGFNDYTREYRDKIEHGLSLAIRESRTGRLSPLEQAERRARIYHALYPVEKGFVSNSKEKRAAFLRGVLEPLSVDLKPKKLSAHAAAVA